LDKTLTNQAANALRDRIYRALHQGTEHQRARWPLASARATTGPSGDTSRTRVCPRPRSQPLKARIRLVRCGCRRHYLVVGPAPIGAICPGAGGAAVCASFAGQRCADRTAGAGPWSSRGPGGSAHPRPGTASPGTRRLL